MKKRAAVLEQIGGEWKPPGTAAFFGHALWAVTTVTTVGYGDLYPSSSRT